MNQPSAYGTFVKRDSQTFRTSAYIQWGTSEESLGCCLLLNPGGANFNRINPILKVELDTKFKASGEVRSDPTMEQLIKIVEVIYEERKPIQGRFHIYNLFTLQNTSAPQAIEEFESLVDQGKYCLNESLVSKNELCSHPWILLGWSVERRARWKNLTIIKEKWQKLIVDTKIPAFGKKHDVHEDYYHPCPLIPTKRPKMLEDLLSLYKSTINKPPGVGEIHKFPAYATKPNQLVDETTVDLIDNNDQFGWFKSSANPESIVKRYSHLGIKEGFRLRAYQYSDGANGNGVVWAIPSDKELPEIKDCVTGNEQYFSAPRPSFALDDFMKAIEGDKTPLSYLQAAIVYHELHEFCAFWHGVSWGRDVILPLQNDQLTNYQYEWEMEQDEPEQIEPHFYYNESGNPVVVFYTINDICTVTLNRYVHTFNKSDYSLQVVRVILATADGGIIF